MKGFIFVFIILLAIDLYVFRTIRNQLSASNVLIKYPAYLIYWLVPVFLLTVAVYFSTRNANFRADKLFTYVGAVFVLFYLPKLVVFVFQFIEDLSKLIAIGAKKLSNPDTSIYTHAEKISRSVFIGRIGLIIAAIPFSSILYGIVAGRFKFTVNRKTLYFSHLPKEFDGFRIVQFSDLHTGSLVGQQSAFRKAFEMINNEKADILVFTGDMVNNTADELDDWLNEISVLNAKQGKFSILGNHDYGDYHRWNSEEDKKANLEKLKNYHGQMGFRLLLNEAVEFERNGERIALLGVENWGEKPFPQLGRLDLATEKVKDIPFKVLLSHDPTHWEYEVLEKTDIALTLSGHTHGMQLAINLGNYSWSPVKFKYKRWRGLYTENDQHLYVNIGLGYIGFPGRVGTDPEITVFELKQKV
ncbi:MAG: metallophosphoesterase [Bacteroidales bacterium]